MKRPSNRNNRERAEHAGAKAVVAVEGKRARVATAGCVVRAFTDRGNTITHGDKLNRKNRW